MLHSEDLFLCSLKQKCSYFMCRSSQNRSQVIMSGSPIFPASKYSFWVWHWLPGFKFTSVVTFYSRLPTCSQMKRERKKTLYCKTAFSWHKGVVIIYGRGGPGEFRKSFAIKTCPPLHNRALRFCPPPNLCTEILPPLNNCTLRFCPPPNLCTEILPPSDHTYLYVLIHYDHSSVNIPLKYIMKMGSP